MIINVNKSDCALFLVPGISKDQLSSSTSSPAKHQIEQTQASTVNKVSQQPPLPLPTDTKHISLQCKKKNKSRKFGCILKFPHKEEYHCRADLDKTNIFLTVSVLLCIQTKSINKFTYI